MKIINNTDLSYSVIGRMIDEVIKSSTGDTIYYGKIDCCKFEHYDSKEIKYHYIKVQIRYLKKYVEWRFDDMRDKE